MEGVQTSCLESGLVQFSHLWIFKKTPQFYNMTFCWELYSFKQMPKEVFTDAIHWLVRQWASCVIACGYCW